MSGDFTAYGEDEVHVFDDILLNERQALRLPSSSADLAKPCGSALAISGGGIRSASFSLGVIQAFVNVRPGNAAGYSGETCFDRFDYMSTVSGGGYIGAAVTWLKHNFGKGGEWQTYLGASNLGARSAEFRADQVDGVAGSKFTWLDFLRQGGSFAKPIGASRMSLAADILGNSLLSLSVYTTILTVLLWCLVVGGVLPVSTQMPSWSSAPQSIENLSLLLMLLIGGTILFSGIASWFASIPRRAAHILTVWISILLGCLAWHLLCQSGEALVGTEGPPWRLQLGIVVLFVLLLNVTLSWKLFQSYRRARQGLGMMSPWPYLARKVYHAVLATLMTLLIVAGVLWSLPVVFRLLQDSLGGWLTAVVGSSIGLVGSVTQFLWTREKPLLGSWVTTLRVLVIGVLLIYGALLLAYLGVVTFRDSRVYMGELEIPVLLLVGLAGLIFANYVNLNYVSIVRTYRDRLMQVFMPDPDSIRRNRTGLASGANELRLTHLTGEDGNPQRPLHLVNCNVMMSDSQQLRFRGRGSDSFVLSPLYCGSSATGWVRTGKFASGSFTFATALACSAAGLNVPAAIADLARSRNPFALLLLSVTNLRPGYWIRNPRASVIPRYWHDWFPPNLLAPGIRQGLLGRGLSEDAFFLELNDGGRFDNTGLYELIRRRLKIIVLAQASPDADFRMEDLARVIRRVRIDFGVHIRFVSESYPLAALRPAQPGATSQRGWAVGTIKYPGTDAQGVLLYIQATAVAGLNVDLEAYRRKFSDFPNPSTADDGLDDEQVESYRELGMAIAQDAIAELKGKHEPWDEPMTALRRTFGW